MKLFPVQPGLLAACICIAGTMLHADTTFPFDRYQVILDRKPFGDIPPPPPAPVKPFNPAESFAKTLKMTALLDDDGIKKVGIVDTSNNNSFFLAVGDSEDGVELVSADYENEKAVLRKGEELAEVQLGTGTINPIDHTKRQGHLNQRNAAQDAAAEQRAMSYAERRRLRQEERKRQVLARKTEATQTRYTGQELKQHLEEYQMEVIRAGLPPLPIPLTEEMDSQLVNEGILPPQ